MKLGICIGVDRAKQAADAGFDYVEPAVTALAAMSEAEFCEAEALLRASGLPSPVFNQLFPHTVTLLDGAADKKAMFAYLRAALARVRRLGGETVVFGSGKSRMRPADMTYGEAFRRLALLSREMGEIAADCGVTLAVEPLNRRETNMINTLSEGACLVAAANHPNVRLLADYYHMAETGDPAEEIERLGGVCHVHLATAGDRRIPLAEDAGIAGLFAALRRCGYAGGVSIEGRCEDLAAEGPVCARLLRRMWEA